MSRQTTRRLSAIVFADIEGYTALMQRDETGAVKSRDRFRDALARAMHSRRGEVVQHYGDGTLTIFESAVEAAQSAVEIQRSLRSESSVPLRIGIHVGDIVRDAEGVYGDGVNVAARIEALAAPGSVLVSDRVADEIRNHPGLRTRFMGQHELKNVVRPVGVHALDAEGLAVPNPSEFGRGRTAGSIAVLPFVNLSRSEEHEYFSDGVTEEIITVLSRIDGLRVTSRTSSFSFKGRNEDVRSIADALDVQHVLEGSVRMAGDRVRITSQLIDARSGYHRFSETYDRGLHDIFAVQDEIAEAIASTLRKTLHAATGPRRATTSDVTAYNLYLQGRHHWGKWTPESATAAVSYYRQAIAKDPDFAAPYAGLATAYCFLGAIGRLTSQDAYAEARAAGERAAKLDPGSAEAHMALGLVALFNEWDAGEARKNIEIARQLNPGLADIRHYAGLFHMLIGNPSAALTELRAALDMDPLSLSINNQMAMALHFSGQLVEALHQFDRTLELSSTFRMALEGKGWVLVDMGRYEDAIATFEEYARQSPTQFAGAAQLGFTYAKMGDTVRAIEYQQRLEERVRSDPSTNLDNDFAVIYLGLGKLDWAFSRLERAVEKRVGGVAWLGAGPLWAPVADHPRFKAVLEKIGLWS